MRGAPLLLLVALASVAAACGPKGGGAATVAVVPKARVKMSEKEIYKAATPAVVRIESVMPGGVAIGSGFIVDARGLIATNLHVVAGASKIMVQLHDGKTELQVQTIIGYSKDHDLAIVSVSPAKPLPIVKIGNSDDIAIGDEVVAIGNPLGMFDYTISSGLISQKRPVPDTDLTLFQISVPISQGSSGGPLFNQFGEVIAVTTGIIGAGQNINIAVPANYLAPLFQQTATGVAEFADKTRALAEAEAAHEGGSREDDDIPIKRAVPNLPIAVYDGCKRADIEGVITAISDAIELGAPLYNEGTRKGYEACFKIYEGASIKLEQSVACKGVSTVFGDGLLRASTLASYKEKAWAMRDAFDGLIAAAQAWATKHPDAAPHKHP
jgi:serine protease Do